MYVCTYIHMHVCTYMYVCTCTFVLEHGVEDAETKETTRVVMLYDEGTHEGVEELSTDYGNAMVITTWG